MTDGKRTVILLISQYGIHYLRTVWHLFLLASHQILMTLNPPDYQPSDAEYCDTFIYNFPKDIDEDTMISDDDQPDNVVAKVKGVQYGTCLHPMNIVDTGDKSYSIAPCEGHIPLNLFMDKKCEALAFPTLFATGKFTLYGDEADGLTY